MEKLVELLNDINPDVDYYSETDLVDSGIFDSLIIMTLIIEIEERFGVSIDALDVNAENFNSAENIWKLIEK